VLGNPGDGILKGPDESGIFAPSRMGPNKHIGLLVRGAFNGMSSEPVKETREELRYQSLGAESQNAELITLPELLREN
jgi:hypothetical protein